ncbi:MAG: sulfur carrier protein ThiS, partial [Candidatus Gastranaerophilales bacterium]|nr:sulfur carrier protein ThiS [Candidatus Gastranaerophilales bacterium]
MHKISITVNGKPKEVDENTTINSLLAEMELKSPMLVVEKNLEIVLKDNYDKVVKDGD